MQPIEPSRDPYGEIYRDFVEFVRSDIQRERRVANRRMFHVFFWCFVMPALTSISLIFMARFGLVPRYVIHYLDWLIVIFPVAYAVYLLSFDAIKDAPTAIRRGGIATTLNRALEEERWRARVCGELRSRFGKPGASWDWLLENFRIDLENLQSRTRYLTALAGAVFFLLFQGVDALEPARRSPPISASSIMGFFENSTSSLAQFVGLGVFLVLFYISGNQIYHSLVRYLQCARLVSQERHKS